MAIPQPLVQALQTQFNKEIESAYLYDAIAADFNSKNLSGFSHWMVSQAAEEREHAQKIHIYLNDHGERVFYESIEKPPVEWESPAKAFEASLNHEKMITRSIHDLVYLARKEKDVATETFLAWFVTEQVEEESSSQSFLDKIKLLGDNDLGLYHLDKEASTRQNGWDENNR